MSEAQGPRSTSIAPAIRAKSVAAPAGTQGRRPLPQSGVFEWSTGQTIRTLARDARSATRLAVPEAGEHCARSEPVPVGAAGETEITDPRPRRWGSGLAVGTPSPTLRGRHPHLAPSVTRLRSSSSRRPTCRDDVSSAVTECPICTSCRLGAPPRVSLALRDRWR